MNSQGMKAYRYNRESKIYKLHYVCFTCRTACKQPNPYDLARQYGKTVLPSLGHQEKTKKVIETYRTYYNRVVKCPNCSIPMTRVGLQVRVPGKNDLKRWESLRVLCLCGFDHISVEELPQNKRQLLLFLETNKTYFEQLLSTRHAKMLSEMTSDYIARISEVTLWTNKEKIST
ncbi:hypothetical protein P4V86_17770 [Brevibacillus laterosporus]|uniref:hypothetical protein n=1 Tax=Brevibacillus laterosporus TaxID=1465 RepID=UPI00036BB555|nr:hypothetical protein [Brevibacillus laterosporus]ATO51631.1 hypothetical protein BrL25_22585 [Brevibacillus laterosporus DSM 25]MBG9803943.1 hypothetical protein [Brevibacillus laterosporus]MED2005190.1 hypothetical protein [Brevibacillus laterosporus]MED4763488.1 hypothetical protein [Brevibacillus laterosporus]TPH16314.1 hypothetical protein EGH09_10795 [Brevibacillus laterosporus]